MEVHELDEKIADLIVEARDGGLDRDAIMSSLECCLLALKDEEASEDEG